MIPETQLTIRKTQNTYKLSEIPAGRWFIVNEKHLYVNLKDDVSIEALNDNIPCFNVMEQYIEHLHCDQKVIVCEEVNISFRLDSIKSAK